MKKRILTLVSMILIFVTAASCFAGCSSDMMSESTDESLESGTYEIYSEQIIESITEKPTSASTKKTTAKPETEPIPGKSQSTTALKAKTYNLGNASDRRNFRTVGRVQYTDTGILFDHCANVLEFQGYMTGDLKLNANSSGGNKYEWTYLTVYIDGKRVDQRFCIEGNDKTITLATFTGNYFHTVRIIKQTEISNSDARLKSISMTGYLTKAPENQKHYIEFYGDSLTAAYGNIGKPGDSNAGSSLHQDATKSYAFMASEALGADCSILAMSGVGVDKGWCSNPFMHYFSKYSYKRGDASFEFKGARVPDVVVIHLGANDITKGTTKANFIKKGKELIEYIHNGYGKKIPIIWAYDPSEQVPDSWREEVINSFSDTTKVYSLKLEWRSIGAGAGGHPNVKAHEKHAELLVNLIKEKNLIK